MSAESPRLIPEPAIRDYAEQFLRRGREGWDIPHTNAAVHFVTVIAACEGFNIPILRTATRFHDIGYYAQFASSGPSDLQTVLDKKAAHMLNGEKLARQFLSLPNINPHFTPEEIELICHLVLVHDRVEELTTPEEIALMEADTLGAIDIDRVKPTFSYDDGMEYIEKHLQRRLDRFQTKTGLALASRLVPRFTAYIESLKP